MLRGDLAQRFQKTRRGGTHPMLPATGSTITAAICAPCFQSGFHRLPS